MASWKLPVFLLLLVVLVLALETEAGRRQGRRRQNNNNNNDDNNGAAVGRRRVWRRRNNGRGVAINPPDNTPDDTDDDDDDDDDMINADDTSRRGPGRRGGGRGGRRRGHHHGNHGGRHGGRRPGRRGGRGRGHGGRRRGGRGPNVADTMRLLNDYAVSSGGFGIRMYKKMADESDNFVISPLSIHAAMSMLLLGASGQTKRELITGLNIRSPIHPAFNAYNQSLVYGDVQNATLMMANAIYTKPDFNPKARFLNKLRTFYKTSMEEFDEEDPEGVINDWVNEKTMDMIQEFLNDGEVTDDMMMMLINAVYFKGLWKDAFDEADTSLETFTDANSDTHDVYMMKRDGFYNMYRSERLGGSAVRIPYKGGRYSMNIILPDPDKDLNTMESRLTHEVLNQTLHMLQSDRGTKIMLELPKFGMDTEQSLNSLLQSVGIREIFTPGTANFRRMTSSRNVFVNKVKHRCMLEMDETGTEASAATGVSVVLTSMSIPFRANRPFMFVLRDDQRSINLFVGRYVNPGGDNLME